MTHKERCEGIRKRLEALTFSGLLRATADEAGGPNWLETMTRRSIGTIQNYSDADFFKTSPSDVAYLLARIAKLEVVAECMRHAVEIGYFAEKGSTEGWDKEALSDLSDEADHE